MFDWSLVTLFACVPIFVVLWLAFVELVLGVALFVVGVILSFLCLVSKCVVSNLSCTCGETVLATDFRAAPTALVTDANVFKLSDDVRSCRLLTLLVLVVLESMSLVRVLFNASISRLCICVSRLLMN